MEFAQIAEVRNEIYTYVGGRKLTDFCFVGIQEFFKDDLTDLAQMLNWPEIQISYENRNKNQDYKSLVKSIQNNWKIVQKLTILNSEDFKLYQAAFELRNKRRGLSNSLE